MTDDISDSDMAIYLSMVNDHLKQHIYVTPPSSPKRMTQLELNYMDVQMPIARASKAEYWESQPIRAKRKYTPYRRLGHFREHLNRINFTQFIKIPGECWQIIDLWVRKQTKSKEESLQLFQTDTIFISLKKLLSRKGDSKYIEHIPYLIGTYRHRYGFVRNILKCTIEHTEYMWLCDIFKSLEEQYALHNTKTLLGRKKRFFSYYTVIQCLFTLLHIHPTFVLPVMRNRENKLNYYKTIFYLLFQTEHKQKLVKTYTDRTDTCICSSLTSTTTHGLDGECLSVLLTHFFDTLF